MKYPRFQNIMNCMPVLNNASHAYITNWTPFVRLVAMYFIYHTLLYAVKTAWTIQNLSSTVRLDNLFGGRRTPWTSDWTTSMVSEPATYLRSMQSTWQWLSLAPVHFIKRALTARICRCGIPSNALDSDYKFSQPSFSARRMHMHRIGRLTRQVESSLSFLEL